MHAIRHLIASAPAYNSTVSSFYVENFGCRATQADGAAGEEQLRRQGLHSAASPGAAQVVVLNTCTVTAAADQDARAAIRRIHLESVSGGELWGNVVPV